MLDENDNLRSRKIDRIFDDDHHLTTKVLMESAWVCPFDPPIEPPVEPPDPSLSPTDSTKVSNAYKLHLRIQAKRIERKKMHDENGFIPVDGLTEGNDWSFNRNDESWFVPELELPEEATLSPDLTYDQTFSLNDVEVLKCEEPSNLPVATESTEVQSDTGANANITSDISILENIQWVQPVQCESAKKGASIEIQAIGQYTIRGTTLRINMYYCPDTHGTIISPTAVIQQYSQYYHGYQKYGSIDRQSGNITLIAREGYEDVIIPLVGRNDLWYHQHAHTTQATMNPSFQACPTVNRLSDGAKWELWHQRLAHPGTRVMEEEHKHADGVPKLRGNAFYRCPSCMANKLCTKKCSNKHTTLGSKRSTPTTPCQSSTSEDNNIEDDELEEHLDTLHLPDALPGQHFHLDFGFVRGSSFKLPTANGEGPTITSVDGKNSYCLIVDRATRHIWVFLSNSKEPPIEPVRMVLRKFGANITHRTARTDQDKGLGKSKDFLKMLSDERFTPELTGSDSSSQNSIAERPHRDLAQMMRCMLHSSELGPEYWSFALAHAVYIKNRLYHASLNTTPFQAFTGKRPNLSRLRIFGSRVYAKKTGDRPAKLDQHAAEGIFLSFSATDSNIYFIDDDSGRVKIGQHVVFDEAHMTVPAGHAPLAAQALQRLGYYVNESWIDEEKSKQAKTEADESLRVVKLTDTAKLPTRGTDESIGYDVYLDETEVTIEPGQIQLLPTGISVKPPPNSYIRIAPRSGLTVKRHLHSLAGVIDPDYRGNITVVLQNFGTDTQVFKRGDKIAQLIVENATTPTILEVSNLEDTGRGSLGFGSTDVPVDTSDDPVAVHEINDHELPETRKPPDKETVSAINAEILNDLHLSYRQPYDIQFSSCPLDNQTFRQIPLFGSDTKLGFDIRMCSKYGMPIVNDCKKSTPCARLPRWRSELRGAFITSVNGKPVATITEFETEVAAARKSAKLEAEVGFATIQKSSMHPQLGVPQLYHDQLNVIGEHLWQLRNDPEWRADVEEALPILEVMKKDTLSDLSSADKAALEDLILKANAVKKPISIKQQKKLTRRILKQLPDWEDWKQSEFKQLDQYNDQDTFGEPEPRPKGANLLSLLWCYLVKDDGRKKARCVCNGNKNRRGTVTLAETYAASLEQTASRVFWAATAINNFITIGADASNAFAEAPAPVAPLYVYVDEQFRTWYAHRYPNRKSIPPGYVLRVKKALQGHPESPRLWAMLIDRIIKNLNLKPCAHEPNLYYTANYANTGKQVLFMKQVDDFSVSCEDRETAKSVIKAINDKMTIDVKELGLISRFNGVDVEQTRYYIKLSNAVYIRKILKNHPWINDEKPAGDFPLPMKADNDYVRRLEIAEPLLENERIAYENELGFSYRQGIGEIIYALVTCRPDISFAAIKLSQYSANPAKVHYDALKDVFRYLKATESEGIYFWRKQPRTDLPIGPTPICKNDSNYDDTVIIQRRQDYAHILAAGVDSDHAGDVKHRKSVSGIVIKLAGGAVLYRTAYQQAIAHSSTEAEFVAACDAGKYILYLRSLLQEIGLRQEDATVLYEDNQGALLMANAQKPTRRTRHIDLKYFGLQEWVQRDLLILHRINTSDNYADAMTKALGRTLFYRHVNFIMGKIVPQFAYNMMDLVVRRLYDRHVSTYDKNLRLLSREGVTPRHISQSDRDINVVTH